MAKDDVTLSLGIDSRKVTKQLNFINNSLKAVAGTFVAVFAGRKIISAFDAITDAASIQEDAINQLNSALRRTGEFSEETSQDFQDFASSLQAVTTVGDETSLELLALAKSFGVSNDAAKELVETSIDAAAALGIDQRTALEQLGGTLSGVQGRLAKFVPEVKDLSQEALKSGDAIAIFGDKFEGAAAALRGTFSGAVTAANNSFGDLQEELGFAITQNPALISALNAISDAFSDIGVFVKENRDEVSDFISQGIIALVKSLKVLSDSFRENFNGINNTFKVFGTVSSVAFTGFRAGVKTIQKVLVELSRAFFEVQALYNEATGDDSGVLIAKENLKAIEQLSDELTKEIAEDGRDIQESFAELTKALGEAPETAQNNKFLELLENISGELDEITDKAKNIKVGGSVQGARGSASSSGGAASLGSLGIELGSDIREFVTSVKSSGQAFGESVLNATASVGQAVFDVLSAGAQAFSANTKAIEENAVAFEQASAEEQKVLSEERKRLEQDRGRLAKESAGDFVSVAAGGIADAFLPGAGQFVSTLLDLAKDPESFQAFVQGFVEALPEVIDGLVDSLPFIIDAFVDNLPTIIRALVDAVPDVIDALVDAAPEIIATLIELAPEVAIKLTQALIEAVPDVAVAIVAGIAQGLGRVFDNLIDNINDALSFDIGGGGGGLGVDLGFAKFAGGGVVPPGFPNDSFPALLTSGERILNEDQQSELSMPPQMITVNLVMDQDVLASQILEINRDNLRTA